MSKELEKAIELAKYEYNLLREVANKTGFDNVENSAEALRLVIEGAKELIKLQKDIDEGVLVVEGLGTSPILSFLQKVREECKKQEYWDEELEGWMCPNNCPHYYSICLHAPTNWTDEQLTTFIEKVEGGG